MKTTILFGGQNRERLVSVASAQALALALPEAELWFWGPDGAIYLPSRETLAAHTRPFEEDLPLDCMTLTSCIEKALDIAVDEQRVLVIGMHGGAAENGELGALCEARGVAYTGTGAAASRLAFDKAATKAKVAEAGVVSPQSIELGAGGDLAAVRAALAEHGKLVAKPVAEGSSYGLIFVDGEEALAALAEGAAREAYLVEPFVSGTEGTCGVLEAADGTLTALPPIEILPADGAFDYAAKYLAAATQEICPGRFSAEATAAIQDAAVKAHRAVGAMGYSRSDFIVTEKGPVFLEINTLPGLTKASLYPKALAAQGIGFREFLGGQIALAVRRAGG
jgi:D-alanine-D-alanine ligase